MTIRAISLLGSEIEFECSLGHRFVIDFRSLWERSPEQLVDTFNFMAAEHEGDCATCFGLSGKQSTRKIVTRRMVDKNGALRKGR